MSFIIIKIIISTVFKIAKAPHVYSHKVIISRVNKKHFPSLYNYFLTKRGLGAGENKNRLGLILKRHGACLEV
jgi:hypothetical protein